MRALPANAPRIAIVASVPLLCSGCQMLGALFNVHPLRVIIAVVVLAAAVAFIASKSAKR